MNTKQVEELTGLSRQNIRYYEKAGLLTPCREQQNSYRDYSREDVERLKLIKMLRMLDMPLKEIEKIIKNEISIQEAAGIRQKELSEQQKQLQAAIDICNLLKKEKSKEISVDKYLTRMESMEKHGNVFAKFIDDYKQIIYEEQGNQFSFFTDDSIHSANDLEKVLKEYARAQNMKFGIKEKGKFPKIYLNNELYSAVCSFENPGYQITCKKITDTKKSEAHITVTQRKIILAIHSVFANIKRHSTKSICSFLISLMLVLLFGIYIGNISQIQKQIQQLPDSVPVYGKIYNSSGTAENHILIKGELVDEIRNAPYVDQIEETVELIAKGENGENIQILALEKEELMQLKAGQCIADSLFLKNNGLKEGDKIRLPIYCYISSVLQRSLTEHFMTEVELEIVKSEDLEEQIQLPLDYAKQLFQASGDAYYASSFAFRVKAPELLNDFKTEMQELGLLQIQSGSEDAYYGTALGIEDATFIEASVKLENNKTLLFSFLPIVLFLLLIAEYLIAYLLLQSRRQEFALMRALGRSKKECSGIFLAEQMILIFAGTIAGSAICHLLNGINMKAMLLLTVTFMLIAAAGVFSAINMLGRFSVAAVLTRRD